MSDLKKIAEKIKRADAILIGASNGLSITEGLHLFADDQAFRELFVHGCLYHSGKSHMDDIHRYSHN